MGQQYALTPVECFPAGQWPPYIVFRADLLCTVKPLNKDTLEMDLCSMYIIGANEWLKVYMWHPYNYGETYGLLY